MPLHKDDPKSVGGYRLVDRLGAGGMGVVYRARSRSGREVAVKVVHAQYAEDPVFRARFRQEIAAVRKVSGAFTAPVVDADPDAARPWMVTQYVPGRSLAARIRDVGPLREPELRALALGLVEALRDIHRAGVIHRDLKPANVLLADDGPRVIDFGISRAAENNTLTETGQMIGTPPFMSPEQLTDARSVGPSSDVFSLGALLVYTVTGRGPFDADSPYLTAYRVVHDEPVLDGVRQPLRAILERCLAKEATDRPELDEVAGEFARVLPETSAEDAATVTLRADEVAVVVPRSPTVVDRGGRRGRRRRLWAVTGVVGALALGLTAYLNGPEVGGDARGGAGSATSSRWAALPTGWEPWQTTVYETAAHGVKRGLDVGEVAMGGGPGCRVYEGDVYCAGDGVLPVRLDGITGRTEWRAAAFPPGTGKGTYTFSVLGIAEDTMVVRQEYMPTDDPNGTVITVAALDTGTGERLWYRTVNDDWVDAAFSGGLVVVPDDGGRSVTARSPRTGAERWTVPLPAKQYCGFVEAGEDLYLDCTPDSEVVQDLNLLRLDRTDGSTQQLTVPNSGTLSGMFEGHLLFLDPTQDEEGNTLMVVDGDMPYSAVRLVHPETGAETTTKLAEEFAGEVTLADGTLYFTTSGGQVTAVSPRTGKELWQTATSLEQPGGVTYGSRTGAVFLSSASGRVAALDAKKGTLLWETLPRAQRVQDQSGYLPKVLLHEGALVVVTPEGDVFTLDPAHPDRKPVSG